MANDPSSSRELTERARSQDRQAFAELVDRARPGLERQVAGDLGRKLRETVDVEDVMQEAILHAWESVAELRATDEPGFAAWLGGIARNVVRNLARRKWRSSEVALERDPAGSVASPSRHQRREERFERLSEAVEHLSPDHRTVIRLARIEGLRIQEIAERMGRTPAAVKNLLLRAMRELRESFGDTESLGLPERKLGEEPPRGD
jgi:RNA polymerase sigma-70 factor (ECF subfamily)